jgi:hypothetical protein
VIPIATIEPRDADMGIYDIKYDGKRIAEMQVSVDGSELIVRSLTFYLLSIRPQACNSAILEFKRQ